MVSQHYQRYDWCIDDVEGAVVFLLIGGVAVCSIVIVGDVTATVFDSINSAMGGIMPDMALPPELAEFFPDLSTAFPIMDGFNDFADAVANFDSSAFGFDNVELTLGHISEQICHMFEIPPEIKSLFQFQ